MHFAIPDLDQLPNVRQEGLEDPEVISAQASTLSRGRFVDESVCADPRSRRMRPRLRGMEPPPILPVCERAGAQRA